MYTRRLFVRLLATLVKSTEQTFVKMLSQMYLDEEELVIRIRIRIQDILKYSPVLRD